MASCGGRDHGEEEMDTFGAGVGISSTIQLTVLGAFSALEHPP